MKKQLLLDQQHDNAQVLKNLTEQSLLATDLRRVLTVNTAGLEKKLQEYKASDDRLNARIETLDQEVGLINVSSKPYYYDEFMRNFSETICDRRY